MRLRACPRLGQTNLIMIISRRVYSLRGMAVLQTEAKEGHHNVEITLTRGRPTPPACEKWPLAPRNRDGQTTQPPLVQPQQHHERDQHQPGTDQRHRGQPVQLDDRPAEQREDDRAGRR